MEFDKIFMAIVMVSLAAFGTIGLLNFWNQSYGTNVGATYNATMTQINVISNATGITGTMAASSRTVDSDSAILPSESLLTRSVKIITSFDDLIGIPHSLLNTATIVMGVPEIYVNAAYSVFIFSFLLLMAYLLLLGVKRLF